MCGKKWISVCLMIHQWGSLQHIYTANKRNQDTICRVSTLQKSTKSPKWEYSWSGGWLNRHASAIFNRRCVPFSSLLGKPRDHNDSPIGNIGITKQSNTHINSAGCTGIVTTITCAHYIIWIQLYVSRHVAQNPKSQLKFVTFEGDSRMSALMRRKASEFWWI